MSLFAFLTSASVPARDRHAGRWLLLVSGGLFIVILAGPAALLEMLYPALAVGVGVLLYRNYPVAYVGYAWWIFFGTPEMRRLVDLHSGRSEISPIMLAPWLVAGLSVFTVMRPSSRAWRDNRLLPFWMALTAIAIGYVVGLFRLGLFAPTYGVLVWAVPVFFGMHIVLMGQRYTELRHVIQHTFLWGTLLMGAYGIYQYFRIPVWDAVWMIESGMTTIGLPRPQQVRVFSTLNSPGPFAFAMVAGLLVLFSVRSPWKVPASVAGYTAFLLSLVRAAWLGWIVAIALTLGQAQHQRRRKFVIGLLVVGSVVGGLSTYFGVVGDRISSLGEIGEDSSFQARMAFMKKMRAAVYADPLGKGIGSAGKTTKLSTGDTTSFDSGLLNVPFSLGWTGALLYAAAVLLLMLRGRHATRGSPETFAVVAFAIAVAMVAQMVALHTLIRVGGMIFWTFMGVVMAWEGHRSSNEESTPLPGDRKLLRTNAPS